jgi:ubiquinone/menaquinone biosynthesis C-methylase UbiE
MKNDVEEGVSRFYNTVGWTTEGGITEAAKRWEDLREHARAYASKCRLRVLRHIPESGVNILDMGSGPIQFDEYLEYSRNFTKRYCVDLSSKALEDARRKIGDHGVFLPGSFFDLPLEENFFDCAVSLLTIFNIDKDKQEEAVRKLIRVTKPGRPVIIVYRNPNTIVSSLRLPIRVLRRARTVLKKRNRTSRREESSTLYFYAHPIEWWNRFSDVARIKILPWRSFDSNIQKALIPNNSLGARIFDLLLALEERFPRFFVNHFEYCMIILTKKES